MDDEQELSHLREIVASWKGAELQARGERLGRQLAIWDMVQTWHDERRRYQDGA